MGPESYIEKFERVVDLLRTTGSYTAVLVSTNLYEVTSDVDSYLKEGDYITVDGLSVRVTSIVSDKVFQVNSIEQTIALSGTWKSLTPYSAYGTRKVINQMLLEKNGGEWSYQKYPLIALRLPVMVTVAGGVASVEYNILIAHYTGETLRPAERIEEKFEPILWPLTKLFIQMLRSSGEFSGFDANYSQIDRMFYGNESGEENIKNVFDDPLDAVEIRGLKLNYFIDGCLEPSISVQGWEVFNAYLNKGLKIKTKITWH